MLTEEEFVFYWIKNTGVTMDESRRLFGIFDGDKNGKFGDAQEKDRIYKQFDYNSE